MAVPSANGQADGPAGESDEAYMERVEAEAGGALDVDAENVMDDATLNMLREFADPRRWETMSRLDRTRIQLALNVYVKGLKLGSTIRTDYVRELFLMMRSEQGWGATQMADIARRGSEAPKQSLWRRVFSMGPKGGNLG